MKIKVHLCLLATAFGLLAAQAKAVPAFALGDRILLTGTDGVSFTLEIVSAPPPGIAGQSFIAKDAATGVGAIVKSREGVVRVTVDDFKQNKIYSFRIKDNVATCTVRAKSTAPDECATCNGLNGLNGSNALNGVNALNAPNALKALNGAKGLKALNGAEFPIASQRAVVDILVAYDQGAKAWAESANWPDGDTIEDFADYAVNKMNMVLESSQLLDKFSYRLVGIVEVAASYDVINNDLLNALRLRNSGALAPVGAAREKYGADTITLLIDRDRSKSTTSGLGYEYLSNNWSFATFDAVGYTCNICDIKTVYERYTMSHEQGHNMGCGHSNRQGSSSGPGCHPYSCGYHFEDAAGTKRHTIMAYENTSPASGTYDPVPYFSSPDITPEDLGVPVGTPTNNNRLTILNNYKNVSEWREHVVPYSWDVRFLDSDGNDISDGSFFTGTLYVTLTNANPDATIFYTTDGTTPNADSPSCASGFRLPILDTTTLTACAVTNGVALSFRTITVNEGVVWSGEAGQHGNGRWIADSSVLAWNDSTKPFNYGSYPSVCFADLAGIASVTARVEGTVAPYSASFKNDATAYVFAKGTSDALIRLQDASFAPPGDLAFNVPVQLDAVVFTNPANHTLVFNAPFGQTVTETSGYCTNMIGIGAYGTLVVAPGAGRTQTFDCFNNVGWFYNNAKIQVGAGTVIFKGPVNNRGLFGSTQFNVAKNGCVVLDVGNAAYDPFYTSAVTGEGMVVYRSLIPSSAARWRGTDWRGTVALTNISTTTLALDAYGNPSSSVRLVGVRGYPGNCANTNITFDTTVELVDAADGTPAWTVHNGYSTACTFISRLKGDGTFQSTKSPNNSFVRQGFAVADASGFSGSLNLVGTQFTFGSTARKNDGSQNGTIYVDAGQTVTNRATWSASDLVVEGELVNRGTLAISNSVTFGAGASFVADALPANGVVLTAKTITTNGALAAAVLGDDRAFVASIIDQGNGTQSLALAVAPLPETVAASITVLNGDWVESVFACELPTCWATNYYPALDTPSAVAAKYDETAANGAKVWQCYMLGLDPTNAASQVSLAMTVARNEIRFAVEGLGETHALDGIGVYWYMKTSTNLVTDAAFRTTRDSASGLSPTFAAHPLPDKPTSTSTTTADTLFYKISVSFVAEDNEGE